MKSQFIRVCTFLILAACAQRSGDDDPNYSPDAGINPGNDSGTVTPPTDGGGTTPAPASAVVARKCGGRCIEFNPGYLQAAINGTYRTLTSADQLPALIEAAPNEARMAGECAAVNPSVTAWVAPGNRQAVLRKDPTTKWYRVAESGLNGSPNVTCDVSYPIPNAVAGVSSHWPQYGDAPLSDLGSHTGGPGMYCNLDNQGRSTGCAIRFHLQSDGEVVLDGQLPNGP